jgi:hypothetical protein
MDILATHTKPSNLRYLLFSEFLSQISQLPELGDLGRPHSPGSLNLRVVSLPDLLERVHRTGEEGMHQTVLQYTAVFSYRSILLCV